jgi:predicted Zn-ribbon and HTH transcriptional regulator
MIMLDLCLFTEAGTHLEGRKNHIFRMVYANRFKKVIILRFVICNACNYRFADFTCIEWKSCPECGSSDIRIEKG